MGYHVGDTIVHTFFKERASNFNEMLLHHIATATLFFCCIYANQMGIGSVIAYLHDIADIFGNLVKCMTTTKY